MFKTLAVVLLALSSLPAPAAPATDSPVLNVFKQWLEAFNSGDATKITAFWHKYEPNMAEPRTSGDLRLREMTGGMKLLKVVDDNGTHLVAVMQEGNGGYSESTLDLASADPLIVKGISGHPVPTPHDIVPAAVNDQDLVKQVQAHVADLSSKNAFSGAILVAHNGNTVMDQAWGMANIRSRSRTPLIPSSAWDR
jgi:hypothetical protein